MYAGRPGTRDQVAASLPDWLDRYSDLASGDDVTLAVLDILPSREDVERTRLCSWMWRFIGSHKNPLSP
jgi:hypothetical protein